MFFFFFFFSSRRRHTRWTGDWSSDVCSSDLEVVTHGGPPLAPGKRVRLTIRPERLELGTTEQAGPNAWRGRIREVVFHGELVRYGVEVPSGVVLRVTRPFRGP